MIRQLQQLTWAALAMVLAAGAGAADGARNPSPLDGTWRWEFTMPDGSTTTPTLRVKTDDKGKITALSRYRSGSTTPVTNLTVQGNAVSFEVVRERDGARTVTRYRGTQVGDKITGEIVSNWTGEDVKYPWEAVRFSDIEGKWTWRPAFPGTRPGAGPGAGPGRGGVTLTLKRDGDKLSGKLDMGRGGAVDIQHGRFRTNMVSFHTVRERDDEKTTNHYWGKFSGETIVGSYTSTMGGLRTNEWRAVRAE